MPFIAVVDDDELVRKSLVRLLRAAGFPAEGHADGLEFIAAAEKHPPDCVVADLHMPKMTGMQLLLHVRRMRSPFPVIVMSGSGTPQEREECLACGAAAYIEKPVDQRPLLNAVAAALNE
jgi:FixJ family two-component response regulator